MLELLSTLIKGANARAIVLDRFTWAKVAERCLAAYAEL